MSRYLLAASAEAQELLIGEAARARHASDREAAVCEGARLVKGDSLDLAERLNRVAALEEDTELRRRADTREIRQRHAQHERARAADYEEGQRGVDPLLPVDRDERAEQRSRRRNADNDRRVDLRKARDEAVELRLRGGSVLDSIRDFGYHRVVRDRRRTERERLRDVDAARHDAVARADSHWHRLAVHSGGVNAGFARLDHAVDRDTLADLNSQNIAYFDVIGVDAHELIAAEDISLLHAELGHIGDSLSAARDREVLEHLADTEKEDDSYRLRILAEGKRSESSDSHQEILIENVAFRQALDRSLEDIESEHEISRNVQSYRHRHQLRQVVYSDSRDEQHNSDSDGRDFELAVLAVLM